MSTNLNSHHDAMSPSGEAVSAVTLPKKLIVCCDGTWMDSDNSYTKGANGKPGKMQNPTNVTRIARAIASEDEAHHPQIVYYQAGVGTGGGLYNQLLGGGTGLGLSEHIREGYAFLVNNYRENTDAKLNVQPDSIFIVGFSRGAFTARSIAGFIGAVGLLKKKAMPHFYEVFLDWENAGNKDYTPQFWDSYYSMHPTVGSKQPDLKLARDFSKIDQYMDEYFNRLKDLDLSQRVAVNIVGVFDTVGALGIPVNPLFQKLLPFLPTAVKSYSWFDTGVGPHINYAFHALALDEHRYPFSPTLWEKPPGSKTQLKQTWFPGAHSNVGGSYPDSGIADITLAWMMDQLSGATTEHPDGKFHHREWIHFDPDYVQYWEKTKLTQKEKEEHRPYRGWGMGYLYESMYFPMTLLGKLVRTPGCYHRTDYLTGKPTNKMLENTNEHVHSCVRARLDMAGRGVELDWSQLFPHSMNAGPVIANWFRGLLGKQQSKYIPTHQQEPLNEWRLKDGHKSHSPPNFEVETNPDGDTPITWEYQGRKQCSTPVMKEDIMGPFEIALIQKDPELAAQIQQSANSWRWHPAASKASPKLAHTF